MMSNAYFLAKFRFDTAENEPAKNLQKFAKFANFANPEPQTGMESAFRTIATSGTLGTGEAPNAFAVLFFVTRELLDPFFIFESRTIYAVYEFLVSQLAEIC